MSKINEKEIKKILEQRAKAPKKIIKLHYLPNAIKESIKDMIEMTTGEENKQLKFLMEDIAVLVDWALARLPIVPPQKEDGEELPTPETMAQK